MATLILSTKQTVVLHEVIRTVRARLGNQVIEIINRAYKLPKFNETGTSTFLALCVQIGTSNHE